MFTKVGNAAKAIAIVLVASPSIAFADTSEQSATFTVIIPPISSSLAAHRQGAAGLWTINARDGLMIDVDEASSLDSGVTIFARSGTPFSLRWNDSRSGLRTASVGSPSQDELVKNRFNVPKDAQTVQTFTLSSI